ncbi:MAG: rubrerythrin [Elusimicrobia bacterium]|nr:rubrerythrin [Elusimicrobiota bacterium]
MFNYLAGEEAKHRKTFEDMASEKEVSLSNSESIYKVKNIFKEMNKKSSEVDMGNYEGKIYNKALDVEQKSINYYNKISDKGTEDQKGVVEKILAEEKKHYKIIGNIIDFVSRPRQWLDDAEWYHLEEN